MESPRDEVWETTAQAHVSDTQAAFLHTHCMSNKSNKSNMQICSTSMQIN